VITGDGDALSIGGNHFMHAIRRNLDVNTSSQQSYLWFDQGAVQSTSEFGKRQIHTRGTIDYPVNPLSLAIASEATLSLVPSTSTLSTLAACRGAAKHKGISFVEVYQNCNIFNDGAFESFAERSVRPDHVLYLEHGKPMIFVRIATAAFA